MNATTEYTGWLSSAGVLRNGGLRPPGTEGMASSKGTNKSKSKVEKDTSFNQDRRATKSTVTAPEKAITRDRVISEGVYAWEGTKVRVRVSKSRGKPYGLVLRDGDWEYTPGIVGKLKASDRLEDVKRSAPQMCEGFYAYGDGVAEVVRTRDGQRLYAKSLDVLTGRWQYASGAMSHLKAEDRLTLEQAAALGKQWHRCMICGRELTNEDSIDRGIGPICAAKL